MVQHQNLKVLHLQKQMIYNINIHLQDGIKKLLVLFLTLLIQQHIQKQFKNILLHGMLMEMFKHKVSIMEQFQVIQVI